MPLIDASLEWVDWFNRHRSSTSLTQALAQSSTGALAFLIAQHGQHSTG